MEPNNHNVFCTFHDAPGHAYPGHPESPQRLQSMREWLNSPPYPEMIWLNSQPASEAEVMLIHPIQMLEALRSACQRGAHQIEPSPTFVTKASYQAALGAVGGTLAVSRRILSEGQGRGFAIVRPPGHHAEPHQPMGFCLLNNVAIAAADAVASGLGRVAILDFDAHHGNGTQAAFWNTPEVGYLSIHEENLYPGSGQIESAPHARGRIINIPLPSFSDTAAFVNIINAVAVPWLRKFQPEMLFVSAGYDVHFSDPLTTATLDTRGFYKITRLLIQIAEESCQERIMFVLEGGYDPRALKDNIQACLAALCGRSTFPDRFGKSPGGQNRVSAQIDTLRRLHHLMEE